MIPGSVSRRSKFVALLLLACGSTAALADDRDSGGVAGLLADEVSWKADSRGPGIFTAVVAGDPKKPGLYVLRVKMLQDAKLPPHRHPDMRSVTVLTGEFHLGLGEVFDVSKMKAYPAGSHILIPPNVPHYGWVKSGESIQQDCGWGPTGSTPVTPTAPR